MKTVRIEFEVSDKAARRMSGNKAGNYARINMWIHRMETNGFGKLLTNDIDVENFELHNPRIEVIEDDKS